METKISILAPFFAYPNANFHIREIAKLTKISHTAVGKHIKQLEKEGYLMMAPTKPYRTYKSNTSSKKYLNLKLYYNLEKIRESGLVENLEKSYEYPIIVLFGSYSKAMDDEGSDVDICIISNVKSQINLEEFKKKIGRDISIHFFDKKKWEESKRKNPYLINNFCNGIVLSGQLEIL